MKELLEKIQAELAQITDIQKRTEARERVRSLMAKYAGEDRIVTMQEVVDASSLENGALKIYKTGIKGLDQLLSSEDMDDGGIRDSELITIAGPTKNGKTTLAMTITSNLIEQGHKPCWFSYEMTPHGFARKMPGGTLPLIYTPMKLKTNSTKWIEEKIVEAIAKYDAGIFFIDHLNYVCDISGKSNENTSVRIGSTMRELKQIAKDWGICLVLMAHTTKIKPTEEPTVASLRDSSFIAAESDTVLYVRRVGEETNYGNQTELFVIANRWSGTNGSTDLEYRHDLKKLEQKYA